MLRSWYKLEDKDYVLLSVRNINRASWKKLVKYCREHRSSVGNEINIWLKGRFD